MDIAHVSKLEEIIGSEIPKDYARFLSSHTDSFLDSSLVFNEPRTGIIDELYTAKDIIKNSVENNLGIPDKGLVHIGSNIMGGFLYIKLSSEGFGEVHYSENNCFKELFSSFSAFIKESHGDAA